MHGGRAVAAPLPQVLSRCMLPLPWNMQSGQVDGQLQLAQLYLQGAWRPCCQQGEPAFPRVQGLGSRV